MQLKTHKIDPLALCYHDPLVKFLLRISKQRLVLVPVIAMLIYTPFYLGFGILISSYYGSQGVVFLSILDPREVPILLFLGGCIIPIVWVYYVWQPISISNVFVSLTENDLIKNRQAEKYKYFLSNNVYQIFNKPLYLVTVVVLIVITTGLWLPTIGTGSSDPFSFGLDQKWWNVNSYYLFLIWLPLILINYFMALMIIVRQFCFIISMSKLYKTINLEPKLFHPDKCNGFGIIGNFAIKMSLLCVVFAFLILFLISYPLLFGERADINIINILSLVIYILVVPVLPTLTVWSTHTTMLSHKAMSLQKIAQQLQALLSFEDVDKFYKNFSQIEALEKKYDLFEREFKVWPFQPFSAARYIITAITPLVGAGVSYIIDLAIKRP